MIIDVTDDELSTICSALINHSAYWGAKAEKGTEGRAQCLYLSNMADVTLAKLMGGHLPVLAIVAKPVAAKPVAKPNGPTGGVLIPKPVPPPVLPPAPRAVEASIDF